MSTLIKSPEKTPSKTLRIPLPMAHNAAPVPIELPTLFEEERKTRPARLADYDWIVISSSGGKDSQAMLNYVCELAALEGVLDRVVVVHCDLGRVEWTGTAEIAEAQAARYGVRFVKIWRRQGDLLAHIQAMGFFPKPTTRYCTSDHKRGPIHRVFTQLAGETVEAQRQKRDGDLLDQIEARGKFPDFQIRYCTSDQKRAPVHRLYTALAGMVGSEGSTPRGPVKILSCQGMRAQESPARAKRSPFQRDERASNGKRHVDNWLALHHWTEEAVWAHIRACRTADLIHYAYSLGMPRVSCVFCIFAPFPALVIAGYHNYDLLCEYVRVEKKIGHWFRADFSLAEVKVAVDALIASGKAPPVTAEQCGVPVGKVSSWAM